MKSMSVSCFQGVITDVSKMCEDFSVMMCSWSS